MNLKTLSYLLSVLTISCATAVASAPAAFGAPAAVTAPITCISFSKDRCNTTSVDVLIKKLAEHRGTIETVSFPYNWGSKTMEDNDFTKLAKAVAQCQNLKKLCLYQTHLTELQVMLLLKGLEGHPALEVVKMTDAYHLSTALTPDFKVLIDTCPNLCAILTKGCIGMKTVGRDGVSGQDELYRYAGEKRNGYVSPVIWKPGLLVFPKQTDTTRYHEFRGVEGVDYFRQDLLLQNRYPQFLDRKFNGIRAQVKEPYFIVDEFENSFVVEDYSNPFDIDRHLQCKRFMAKYEHTMDGFEDGCKSSAGVWVDADPAVAVPTVVNPRCFWGRRTISLWF